MKYGVLSKELREMLKEDQEDIIKHARFGHQLSGDEKTIIFQAQQLKIRQSHRAKKMLEIIEKIKEPTLSNIGEKASIAVYVIALHDSEQTMIKILQLFNRIYKNEPENVYIQAIPPLVDRVAILNNRKQKFGTQWLKGQDGEPFLYPISNFSKVNIIRSKFGLGTIVRPVVVAFQDPKVRPKRIAAKASDQRSPTYKELQQYIRQFK